MRPKAYIETTIVSYLRAMSALDPLEHDDVRVTVVRAMARRLPSRDHAASEMVELAPVKWVSWRGGLPSSGSIQRF